MTFMDLVMCVLQILGLFVLIVVVGFVFIMAAVVVACFYHAWAEWREEKAMRKK